MNSEKKNDLIRFASLVVILLSLNVVSSFLFQRFDLTTEKRFSLSPATKNLLSNLKDIVYVKVYLEGEFPAGFKRLRNSTKEMLDEFKAYGGDKIQYEFINPSESSDTKERNRVYNNLADKGLQPTNLQVNEGDAVSEKIIFPGAVVTYINNDFSVQLLKDRIGASSDEMLNNSIQGLEYEFANAIRQLSLTKRQKIGIITGHGEADSLQLNNITHSLKANYIVEIIPIEGQIVEDSLDNNLLKYRTIIIAKPQARFMEPEKFLLDQFVMNGGRILWLLDGIDATMDSLKNSANSMALELPLNLSDQLFKYGCRINSNLIMDLKSGAIPLVTGYTGTNARTELRPWYYFPLSFPENSHPIVNNLNAIQFKFASSIDTVGVSGISKTVLLRSSEYSKVLFSPARVSLSAARDKPIMSQYNKKHLSMAVLLEGEFKSVFSNRVPVGLTQFKLHFKDKSPANKMIVVSDGDIILNDIKRSTGEIYPLGYDSYTGQQYGNKSFLMNCIDYLCDDSGLMAVRSRELKLRMLDKTKVDAGKFKYQLINSVLPLVLVVLLGFLQVFLRRRKFGV